MSCLAGYGSGVRHPGWALRLHGFRRKQREYTLNDRSPVSSSSHIICVWAKEVGAWLLFFSIFSHFYYENLPMQYTEVFSFIRKNGKFQMIRNISIFLFCYMKAGFKGVYITRTCFPEDISTWRNI